MLFCPKNVFISNLLIFVRWHQKCFFKRLKSISIKTQMTFLVIKCWNNLICWGCCCCHCVLFNVPMCHCCCWWNCCHFYNKTVIVPMLFCALCQHCCNDAKKFFLSLKQFNLLWLLLLLLLLCQCVSIAAAAVVGAVSCAVSSANAKKTAIGFLCERTRTHDQSEMTIFVSSGNCFEKVMLLHVQLKCTRAH